MEIKPKPETGHVMLGIDVGVLEATQLIKDIPNTSFKAGWWLIVDRKQDKQLFMSDDRFHQQYTLVTVSPEEFAESSAVRGTVELETLSEAPIG